VGKRLVKEKSLISKFGMNWHEFFKKLITLTEVACAISAFCKTRLCKLIPN